MTYATDLPAPDNRSVGAANPPEDNNLNSRAITAIRDELGTDPSAGSATVEAALAARIKRAELPPHPLEGYETPADGNWAAAFNGTLALGKGMRLTPGVNYRVGTALNPIPHGTGIMAFGRGSSGPAEATIQFDLDNLTDGLVLTHDGVGTAFGDGGYLIGLNLTATTDRVTVRDLVRLHLMAGVTFERVHARGAGRYGFGLNRVIDFAASHIKGDRAKSAGLWIGADTSVSTSCSIRAGYFNETRDGPGADIAGNGIGFTDCVFESNGNPLGTPAAGHGLLVRSGYVTVRGYYGENNAAWDIMAGTVGTTHLEVDGFHSATGSYSLADPNGGHLYLDQFVRSALLNINAGTARKFMRLHPLAEDVMGQGRWAGTPVTMTDASAVDAAAGLHLLGRDVGTGERYALGRVDGKFRNAYFTNPLRVPDGTAAAPGVTFATDLDTGLYRIAADRLGATAGGQVVMDIASTYCRSLKPFRADYGTALLPGYGFHGDDNTGFRRVVEDVIGMVIGGVDGAQISPPLDGETALLVRRNVGGVFSLDRVSMGAADSGGVGYKVLRVPN